MLVALCTHSRTSTHVPAKSLPFNSPQGTIHAEVFAYILAKWRCHSSKTPITDRNKNNWHISVLYVCLSVELRWLHPREMKVSTFPLCSGIRVINGFCYHSTFVWVAKVIASDSYSHILVVRIAWYSWLVDINHVTCLWVNWFGDEFCCASINLKRRLSVRPWLRNSIPGLWRAVFCTIFSVHDEQLVRSAHYMTLRCDWLHNVVIWPCCTCVVVR